MCMNKIFIMKRLLRKLVNLNMWGGKHTELLNLKKCIPKHLRGTKDTDKAIKELIQNFFIFDENAKLVSKYIKIFIFNVYLLVSTIITTATIK